MTTPTRAEEKLQALTNAATNAARLLKSDCPGAAYDVLRAALSNPTTKEVSVWRVDYAQRHHVTGQWLPYSYTWPTEEYIRAMEEELRGRPDSACVKVTGPHMQEVPNE